MQVDPSLSVLRRQNNYKWEGIHRHINKCVPLKRTRYASGRGSSRTPQQALWRGRQVAENLCAHINNQTTATETTKAIVNAVRENGYEPQRCEVFVNAGTESGSVVQSPIDLVGLSTDRQRYAAFEIKTTSNSTQMLDEFLLLSEGQRAVMQACAYSIMLRNTLNLPQYPPTFLLYVHANSTVEVHSCSLPNILQTKRLLRFV